MFGLKFWHTHRKKLIDARVKVGVILAVKQTHEAYFLHFTTNNKVGVTYLTHTQNEELRRTYKGWKEVSNRDTIGLRNLLYVCV